MLRSVLRVSIVSGCVLLTSNRLHAQERMPSLVAEVPAVPASHLKHSIQSAPPAMAADECNAPPVSSVTCAPAVSELNCAAPCVQAAPRNGRPRIVVDTQEPEVIFRRVPAFAGKSCTSASGAGCEAAIAGPQSARTLSATAPAPSSTPLAASAPTMTYAQVPVMTYQMQMVPTVQYQTVAVPQQSTFVTQAAAVQPAFFNQSFAAPQAAFAQPQALGLGAGIGGLLLDNLLQGFLANNRLDPNDLFNTLLNRQRNSGQTCPDQFFQDLTKQLKALNDKNGGSTTPANQDKVVESLARMTIILDGMSKKLDEHDKAIQLLQPKK